MATEYINTPDGIRVKNTSQSPNPEWLMGGNSNAIERQEVEGQKQLVASSQLPTTFNGLPDLLKGTERTPDGMKAIYQSMGIKVIGPSKKDELFFDVNLPEGWKLEATDHSMWNKLVNADGEEIASIFYKASFYDRDAFINIK